ncbi:MAG: molybdenum cofactor biosynthesis protein MoaE, partial [Planctomycetes bacterium]|nr:molybdenum cofactor biosynthesis protein MoaE [Planctomycetota bacterium]
ASEPFDPYDELRAAETALGERRRRVGAAATFVGSMRDFNEGEAVESMWLEHYPGMTERHLEGLVAAARARWQLDHALIVHRVGEVRPGDPIVLVAVWSAHRAHAFESCRHLMEELKSTAPFWKKEQAASGARWVANNTPGSSAEFDPR